MSTQLGSGSRQFKNAGVKVQRRLQTIALAKFKKLDFTFAKKKKCPLYCTKSADFQTENRRHHYALFYDFC